ncbi:MAG: archease [bacterium]|nr:archease [bacterium]
MKELFRKLIPPFLLSWYHYILPLLGAIFYRFPSKNLKVIGVTGTNGKTTVVNFITKILEEAGYKVASLSGIKFQVGEKEWPNTLKMTMPGRFRIQKFLRQAVNAGCQYAVLEVTSEGIKQHRHRFINFDVAVFTNLSPEHIEAHGGFENYKKAKGKLFQATKNIHVINIDDKNAEYFLQFPARKKYTYGLNKGDINTQNTQFKLKLIGNFNIYNALAAISVGISQGIHLETCKSAVEKVEGIPGRMEEVISQPFKVFVDYAFTPNALGKVYQTLKPQNGKMICVLGACGGGRDKWKRPILGEIAGEHCDKVIVTNEDPYDENPMEIIEQVAKGAGNKAKKILDRRKAIRTALVLAKERDAVVITGKGCEPWIVEARGKKIPWDDREVVREEFKKLNTELPKEAKVKKRTESSLPMKKYEILEHRADLKIRAFGKSKEKLFSNALFGMTESQKPEIKKPEEKNQRSIKIQSLDLPSLLVDFLSEVLYQTQINKEIYNDIKFTKLIDTELEAELIGQKVERFGEDIKAVTYHNLDIHKNPKGIWEATVLFDI